MMWLLQILIILRPLMLFLKRSVILASKKRINKFALAFPSISKMLYPIRHDNGSEIAFFWNSNLQLSPKSGPDFNKMAMHWNTILSPQLGHSHFCHIYPKRGRLLKKFDRSSQLTSCSESL